MWHTRTTTIIFQKAFDEYNTNSQTRRNWRVSTLWNQIKEKKKKINTKTKKKKKKKKRQYQQHQLQVPAPITHIHSRMGPSTFQMKETIKKKKKFPNQKKKKNVNRPG